MFKHEIINYETVIDSMGIIRHCQFTQVYYVIPESKYFYESLRDELIHFHRIYSNKLEIFLILDSSFSEDPSINSSTGFRDIQDIATMIKNLLNSYSWKPFKFYLFGIYPFAIAQPRALYK